MIRDSDISEKWVWVSIPKVKLFRLQEMTLDGQQTKELVTSRLPLKPSLLTGTQFSQSACSLINFPQLPPR